MIDGLKDDMRLKTIAYSGKDPHRVDRRAYTHAAGNPVRRGRGVVVESAAIRCRPSPPEYYSPSLGSTNRFGREGSKEWHRDCENPALQCHATMIRSGADTDLKRQAEPPQGLLTASLATRFAHVCLRKHRAPSGHLTANLSLSLRKFIERLEKQLGAGDYQHNRLVSRKDRTRRDETRRDRRRDDSAGPQHDYDSRCMGM